MSHAGWNRGVFTVASRRGLTLQAPNLPGSRNPLIEVVVTDVYRLDALTWTDPGRRRWVLDLGAHVGSFTCALAFRLPGAEFICVEPSASARVWLRRNVARNDLSERCTIFPWAIAQQDGIVELWSPGRASADASLCAAAPGAEVERVPGRSLDSVVTAMGTHPEIVKLDCEGGEYAAILDSSPGSWASVELVMLEYHPVPGHHFSDLVRRLQDLGLDLTWQAMDARHPDLGMAQFARRTGSRQPGE